MITSSLETANSTRNFACPAEPIVYICSGPGTYLEWYIPPLLNQSDALFYRSGISQLGEGLINGPINTNLISITDGIVSELTLNEVTFTALPVFCRTGPNSISTTGTSVQYSLSSK